MRPKVVVVLVSAVALTACAPVPASDTAAARALRASPADDSLRAVVERVGSEPQTRLIARAANGTSCALRADASALLAAAVGLEVTLWGVRTSGAPPMMPGTSCTFEVRRFAVRAANGVPAVDGIIRTEGSSFVLELASGERRELRDVPAALRSQAGARIFWAGPLNRAPQAYGILREAPR